jgi:hypothetical protein
VIATRLSQAQAFGIGETLQCIAEPYFPTFVEGQGSTCCLNNSHEAPSRVTVDECGHRKLDSDRNGGAIHQPPVIDGPTRQRPFKGGDFFEWQWTCGP